MFAQYTPLVLMIIMTIMMIEAAGSVDENTMTPLPGDSYFNINSLFNSVEIRVNKLEPANPVK